MHLLPSSLFGRLIVVLFIGLLLAQLLSTIILFNDRQQQMSKIREKHFAQRMVETVQVLDSLADKKQREQFLAALSTRRLQVALATTDCVLNAAQSPIFAPLLRILQHRLGKQRPLCIVEIEALPTHMFNLGLKTPLLPAFFAKIQLQDGNWVVFEHIHLTEKSIATPWRLLIILIVLLFTVLTLSLLAVRWFTRPLAILAEAAEHLGRNIHHSPLPENGPTEVRRAAHAFNTMQTRLKRYLEDRARILIAVSHDLKTPITRLRLRVEQLNDEQIRNSFLRDLDEMQSMTAATLDFMHGLENQEQLQLLDVRALLESLQADYEDMGILVTIKGDDTPPPYPARPQAIKRCLVNLIDNAYKYGEQVTVTLKTQPEQLQIIITDKGKGIPEEALETVFEPFYRLETSRNRATGGTGLGLSIARNIARAHGGDIILHNRKGLEVILNLPWDKKYQN
jgi:signal transduction histidine kinase